MLCWCYVVQLAGHSATEKLGAAVTIVDDLKDRPAAALGKRGGLKTAERGPDYFKKIAGMRKTNAGGDQRRTHEFMTSLSHGPTREVDNFRVADDTRVIRSGPFTLATRAFPVKLTAAQLLVCTSIVQSMSNRGWGACCIPIHKPVGLQS